MSNYLISTLVNIRFSYKQILDTDVSVLYCYLLSNYFLFIACFTKTLLYKKFEQVYFAA